MKTYAWTDFVPLDLGFVLLKLTKMNTVLEFILGTKVSKNQEFSNYELPEKNSIERCGFFFFWLKLILASAVWKEPYERNCVQNGMFCYAFECMGNLK